MRFICALIFAGLLLVAAPVRALTVSQVVEASDLIAKVKSAKADLDRLDKMKGDDVQARIDPVVTCNPGTCVGITSGWITTCSPCIDATYLSVVLSKDIVRKALQKRLDDLMDRLNELGIKP